MLKMKMFSVLALIVLVAPAVRADEDISQRAVNRAHNLLKKQRRGQDILSYVHFGASYNDHNYTEIRRVKNAEGEIAKGHFALIYNYEWEDDGKTGIAFLCDSKGNVYEVQIVKTNAVLNQPFVLANATIKLLGNLLIEAFREKMTVAQRKEVQRIVDDADAKALLEWSLKFQQRLED